MKRDLLHRVIDARAKGLGVVLATRLDTGAQRLIERGDKADALAAAITYALMSRG